MSEYNGDRTWLADLNPPSIFKEVEAALTGKGDTYIDYTTIPVQKTTPAGSPSKTILFVVIAVAAVYLISKMRG